MIGMLRGKVWEVQADKLILDVQGVGYQLSAPHGLLAKAHSGHELIVYTHVILREDELALYGFSSAAEKELFLLMLSVSGIGPKAALSILSTLGTGQTESAIASENITLLTKVPGIGKKTAQRLILELKEKFKGRGLSSDGTEGSAILPQAASLSEAMETLLALGFSQEEAKKALQALPDSVREASTEEQVRIALRSLAASK
ncbi:Holliday junction branch migration protein RuvA [Desulfitobacterium sp. PCE1]|uniref:Holliday junction branch migration protein RuvA n=1 Tax=Desulfitobacterium sp. PCE1 TaxID=146907 RepID=UPI000378CF44|nr:Holliday junction branch migration protein RuvA [Desulfitobacterium sp. PCE1]